MAHALGSKVGGRRGGPRNFVEYGGGEAQAPAALSSIIITVRHVATALIYVAAALIYVAAALIYMWLQL